MTKPTFLLITAAIIAIILASSFSSFNPIAHGDFSNSDWQVTVNGLVEHPMNLTLADIVAMPKTTIYAELICVGAPNLVLTTGKWTGVRLGLLLEEAGVSPDAIKVAFYAKDGYTTDLTLETSKREDIILAYEKDGTPLGETLRLVVPGCWGYKWIAMVSGIELVNYDFLGKYESSGYSDEAIIQSSPNAPGNPPILIGPNLPPTSTPAPLPSPSPSLTPTPSTSPPSNSSDSVSSQSHTPMPQIGSFSVIGTPFAIAAVGAVAVVVAVVAVLRKRAKQKPI